MKLPFHLASTRFRASTAVRLFNENGRRHLPSFGIAFVLLAIAAAATGASAYIMKDIINEIFVDRNENVLYLIAAAIAAIFTAKGLSSYFSLLILEKTGNSIVASIQNRIYHKLIHSRMSAYDGTDLGNLTTRFTHNAAAARRALNLMIVTFGRDALSLVSLVAVMVIQDPMLSAAFFLAGPPIIYLVMRIMKSIKGIVQSEFAAMTRIPSLVKESYIGVRVIKTFQLEDRFEREMQAAVAQVQDRLNAMVRLSTLTVPMMEVFAGLSIAGVVLLGGGQVVDGSREPGAFFSFLTALLLAYDPARRLARFHVDFGSAMVGVQMLYDFLDEDVDERDAPGATPLRVEAGEIRFEDVRFSYGEGDAVALRGVDLVAPARKVTALVGPSGAGKSTLFSLLTRLYEPSAGRILIDGAPISQATISSLRGAISLVSQDNWLFEGTVGENIAYGAEGASGADILRAAEQARVAEFLDALPDGLDSQVGESGRALSGGQRQRVSIARAFLRERPILLLDEATASLDSLTEAAVKAAIDELMQDRTTLVIAHRLSTVLHADQIVVMAEGKVAATGSHAELLERSPLYKAIFDAQFAEAARTTAAG